MLICLGKNATITNVTKSYIALLQPTEASLTRIETRTLIFPNGRLIKVCMSQWHWHYVAWYDLQNKCQDTSKGILWSFGHDMNDISDSDYSAVAMEALRIIFDEHHSKFAQPPSAPKEDSWEQHLRGSLLSRVTPRDITFANGHTIKITMSDWHWSYAEHVSTKEGAKRYSEGFLGDLCEKLGDVSDDEFSDAAMKALEEIYEVDKGRPTRWMPSEKYSKQKPIAEHPSITKWTGATAHTQDPVPDGRADT